MQDTKTGHQRHPIKLNYVEYARKPQTVVHILQPTCTAYVFVDYIWRSRRRERHIGHARLCVCLSVAACQHFTVPRDRDVTWGNGRGYTV